MTIHDLFKDDTIPRTPTPAFVSTNEDQISSLLQEALPKIQVLGIGGAGNNAIDRLIEVGITGAQTVAMNRKSVQPAPVCAVHWQRENRIHRDKCVLHRSL